MPLIPAWSWLAPVESPIGLTPVDEEIEASSAPDSVACNAVSSLSSCFRVRFLSKKTRQLVGGSE